jgi:type IV secretion system protein VirD4
LKDKTEQTLSSALDTIRKLDLEQGGYSSKTPLDYLFDDIEKEDPDSFAVRQYKTFRIGAGKTRDNIILS